MKKKYIGTKYNKNWKTDQDSNSKLDPDRLIKAIQDHHNELMKALENKGKEDEEFLKSLGKKRELTFKHVSITSDTGQK